MRMHLCLLIYLATSVSVCGCGSLTLRYSFQVLTTDQILIMTVCIITIIYSLYLALFQKPVFVSLNRCYTL